VSVIDPQLILKITTSDELAGAATAEEDDAAGIETMMNIFRICLPYGSGCSIGVRDVEQS
jgi:hypothetical protein